MTAKRLCCLILAALLGCGAALPAETPQLRKRMETLIGRLHLNCRYLDEMHGKLQDFAESAMVTPESDFNYLQKTYLFVNEAGLICRCQYKLLSMTEIVKAESFRDWARLRAKDLDQAILDARHTVRLLNLYAGFIDHEEALKTLDTVVGIIEANIYMFDQLQAMLVQLPAALSAGPPTPEKGLQP